MLSKPILKKLYSIRNQWWLSLLWEDKIDYWSFNYYLRKPFPFYQLIACKKLKIAKRLKLNRIKKIKGLWWGILTTKKGCLWEKSWKPNQKLPQKINFKVQKPTKTGLSSN